MSWLRATMAETKLDSLYEPLVYFLETCCVPLVFAVGAWDVAGGRLSLAGLLAFAACLAYLYPPVQSLSGLVPSLSEASASAPGSATSSVLRLASRQPQEQARDWPCVPSPLAEVPARSVLT
jgi:ABC-type bacteriocin/lantibiotic exporter with double-glycine peptidase domain